MFDKKIKEEVQQLKKRLLMLECPHNTKDLFIIMENDGWVNICVKKCNACNKIIEAYYDQNEMLIAKNNLMKELIVLNEKEINMRKPKKIWDNKEKKKRNS